MIPFRQYLRPDGRQAAVNIERPEAIEAIARAILAAGCRFEAEVLLTGEASFEVVRDVADPDVEDSIAIEIVPNGPEVPAAVDRLVMAAAATLGLPVSESERKL